MLSIYRSYITNLHKSCHLFTEIMIPIYRNYVIYHITKVILFVQLSYYRSYVNYYITKVIILQKLCYIFTEVMLPIYGSYVNYVSYHIIEIMLYFIIQKLLYYRSHDTHLQKSCNLSYYRSYAIFHNLEV